MSVRKTARFLSPNLISELVWETDSEKQGYPVISYENEEGFQTSQGCHTCNQIAQHAVVKCPAVQSHQLPLKKRKFFIMGQV
jgi:hypothetical protein